MFPKKNKPAQANPGTQEVAPPPASGGHFSLFAPTINPTPSYLDLSPEPRPSFDFAPVQAFPEAEPAMTFEPAESAFGTDHPIMGHIDTMAPSDWGQEMPMSPESTNWTTSEPASSTFFEEPATAWPEMPSPIQAAHPGADTWPATEPAAWPAYEEKPTTEAATFTQSTTWETSSTDMPAALPTPADMYPGTPAAPEAQWQAPIDTASDDFWATPVNTTFEEPSFGNPAENTDIHTNFEASTFEAVTAFETSSSFESFESASIDSWQNTAPVPGTEYQTPAPQAMAGPVDWNNLSAEELWHHMTPNTGSTLPEATSTEVPGFDVGGLDNSGFATGSFEQTGFENPNADWMTVEPTDLNTVTAIPEANSDQVHIHHFLGDGLTDLSAPQPAQASLDVGSLTNETIQPAEAVHFDSILGAVPTTDLGPDTDFWGPAGSTPDLQELVHPGSSESQPQAVGPDTWSQPSFQESLDESGFNQLTAGQENLETSWHNPLQANAQAELTFEMPDLDEPEPAVLSPETPAITDASLWENLGSSQQPANPMASLAPGQFLDSVSNTLYPDDPFSSSDFIPQADLHPGAYEPESLNSAHLFEGEQAFEQAAQILFPETLQTPPDWNTEPAASTSFGDNISSMSLPDSFGNPYGDIHSTSLELGPSYQLEPVGFNDISAGYTEIPAPEVFSVPETSSAVPSTSPSLNDSFSQPQMETVQAPFEVPSLAPLPDTGLWPSPESAASTNTVPEATAWASQTDQDFYLSSYSLDSDGELLPSQAFSPQSGHEGPTTWTPPAPAMPSPSEWSQAAAFPDAALTAPFDGLTMAPGQASTEVHPPLSSLYEPESTASSDSSLEAFNTPASAANPFATAQPSAPSAEKPATGSELLSMDNLEILGVCPLVGEKRLLLVRSNEVYALMGQSGTENPQVSVLKLFDHNPAAYQNTFMAAQEGQTGEQGMFVVQLGTWHAIVSTFQHTITIHTELG